MARIAFDDLMEELRGFHPQFSPEAAPPVVVRRFLVRALNNAIGNAAAADPDTVSESAEVDFKAVVADPSNPRNRIEVSAFRQILGSIRVARADGHGDGDRRVEIVSLATQYPTPFARHVTFPALATRGYSVFELTNPRRVEGYDGETWDDWDNYQEPLYYDFVPFHRTSDYRGAGAEVEVPDSLQDTVLYSAAVMLAKRGGLFEYAAALEGQYGQATATNVVAVTEDGER
ncbi:MAG: hypothetical protein OXH68_15240 [Gammaproteobacteria bacterium]|nr:hypothetical protein [Gammaproteobacteria bacterium]